MPLNFYELNNLLNEQEIPFYDPDKKGGVLDPNTWQATSNKIIADKKLKSDQVLEIYCVPECLNTIRNFPNKEIFKELQKCMSDILIGKADTQLIKKTLDICSGEKFYQLENALDCVKSSCKNKMEMLSLDKHEDKEKKEILTLPKEIFISICNYGSFQRTTSSTRISLKEFLNYEYSNDEMILSWSNYNFDIKKIFPVLDKLMHLV